MKKFIKNKVITGIVVSVTFILAGVAIFTALRLYQIKQSISPTSPESRPSAWDCNKYVFSINSQGVVTVSNQSTRNEPSQQAKVLINGTVITTLNVPALNQGQSATLGTITLPSGTVKWEVQGTLDCKTSGELSAPKACQGLSFNFTGLTSTPTVTPKATVTLTTTPSITATPSHSPTPTEPGNTSTPTPTNQPGTTNSPTPTNPGGTTNSPTPTNQPVVTNSPTPTSYLAQNSPTTAYLAQNTVTPRGGVGGTGDAQLPAAGYDLPTIVGIALGVLLIVGAFILAI